MTHQEIRNMGSLEPPRRHSRRATGGQRRLRNERLLHAGRRRHRPLAQPLVDDADGQAGLPAGGGLPGAPGRTAGLPRMVRQRRAV